MQNIIQKAIKGNQEAMTTLYNENKAHIMCLCQALLLDQTEAEKVTISIFEKAMKELAYKKVNTEEDFCKFAIRQTVMRSKAKALNISDRAFRTPKNTDFKSFSCDPEDMELEGTPVRIVLNNLPPYHRFIYVMDAIGGYTTEEIARSFNTTEKVISRAIAEEDTNVKRILAAAKRKKGVQGLDGTSFKETLREDAKVMHVPESVDTAVMQNIRKICEPIQKEERKKKNWQTVWAVVGLMLLSFAILSLLPERKDTSVDLENARPTESVETTAPTEEETVAPTEMVSSETGIYADITIEDYGTITVLLDADAAPETVENFVTLANENFYDGLTFHRIIEDFMMQGGDPDGDETGGNTDADGNEINITGEFADNGFENDLSHIRGAISMARANDYNSASSQFFIVHEDSTFLDGQYAVFGYVTNGMEIVDAICESAEPTDDNGTIEPDDQPIISSITIREVTETAENTETAEETSPVE